MSEWVKGKQGQHVCVSSFSAICPIWWPGVPEQAVDKDCSSFLLLSTDFSHTVPNAERVFTFRLKQEVCKGVSAPVGRSWSDNYIGRYDICVRFFFFLILLTFQYRARGCRQSVPRFVCWFMKANYLISHKSARSFEQEPSCAHGGLRGQTRAHTLSRKRSTAHSSKHADDRYNSAFCLIS